MLVTFCLALGTAPAATADTAVLNEFLDVARDLRDGDYQLADTHTRRLELTLRNPELPLVDQLETRLQLAERRLIDGREESAVVEVERVLALLNRAIDAGADWQRQHDFVLKTRAVAYMRLAEHALCLGSHDGCPIRIPEQAVQAAHDYRRIALDSLLRYLTEYPNDVEARWLANIVADALGEHPESVPDALRMELPTSQGNPLTRFEDHSRPLGVDAFDQAGGVMLEDFNRDGRLDIVTSTMDAFGSMRLFVNTGTGFEERTAGSGLDQQLGALNVIGADYDNDGDVDLYALRGAWMEAHGHIRNSLIRNDGGGRFTDVTRASRLGARPMPTQAAVWGDFNNNGHLDLYVGNETRSDPSVRSTLYRNNGDGTFTDVTDWAGVRNDRFAKAVAAGDYDNDGDLDLFVSNRGKNRLYRNDGAGRFRDVASRAGVTNPKLSFISWFFDYDNDGWLDLFVNGFGGTTADVANDAIGARHNGTTPSLYRNRGNGRFEDVTRKVGLDRVYLAMGANFGDVDGDGFLDIYLGTGKPAYETVVPNALLRNLGGTRFQDVSAETGLGFLQKGHGVAFNDIDHDGDLDLYHQLGGMYPGDRSGNVLMLNPGVPGRYLKLELLGVHSNRQAVGARVAVTLETPRGRRVIHRAAGMVSGFGGSSLQRLDLGLGDATGIAELSVHWPASGVTDVHRNVPLDSSVRIQEGGDLALLDLPDVRLDGASGDPLLADARAQSEDANAARAN